MAEAPALAPTVSDAYLKSRAELLVREEFMAMRSGRPRHSGALDCVYFSMEKQIHVYEQDTSDMNRVQKRRFERYVEDEIRRRIFLSLRNQITQGMSRNFPELADDQ